MAHRLPTASTQSPTPASATLLSPEPKQSGLFRSLVITPVTLHLRMAIKISIEHQSTLFKTHFEEENNDRIIFSGAFGIGKTYFLEQFLPHLTLTIWLLSWPQ